MTQVQAPIARIQSANLPEAQRATVLHAIEAHRHRPGALLPVLHAVQDALGYVPPESLGVIAHELGHITGGRRLELRAGSERAHYWDLAEAPLTGFGASA